MANLRVSGHCILIAVATLASSSTNARADDGRVHFVDLCPREADGHRGCDVKIRTDAAGNPIHSLSSPVGGYAPADLESAYSLPVGGGAGKLVVLFGGNSDYPQAESDLGVYRAQYNLPACTSANGCFMKVDEHGGTDYPAAGSSEVEQALDMEMASAACPACRIMLIEGGDMDVALATVIAKGASAFSFSVLLGFGSATTSECQSLGFNDDTGLVITAALGDTGYPGARDFIPAACQGTLAAGGTTLNKATSSRGWAETTWSGTGSGCSPYVAKPGWQTDTGCTMRMEGDVASVADPGTGMSIYNTLGASGWLIVGGTSAAAPLIAGALTNLGIANGHFTPAWIWQNPINFYDITTGSNGTCSGDPSYFCNSNVGYDGPTGWGTLNGNLLQTALPPGTTSTGTCNTPTGSYSQSCAECVAGMRTTGCTLVCQTCTEIDGSENISPTLGLPCDGSVINDNGQLQCVEAPDAGHEGDAGVAKGDAGAVGGKDAGATDAGNEDGGKGGGADASTPDDGGLAGADAGAAVDGSVPADASASPSGASGGCACEVAGGRAAPGSMALGVAVVLAFGIRRRRAR